MSSATAPAGVSASASWASRGRLRAASAALRPASCRIDLGDDAALLGKG
jgi:hypothetical protein